MKEDVDQGFVNMNTFLDYARTSPAYFLAKGQKAA